MSNHRVLSKPITVIAACQEKDHGLGAGGKIPWKAPTDLSFFKQVTSTAAQGLRNAVIMGRKTYESIGHPLSGRVNYVVTRTLQQTTAAAFCDLETALKEATTNASVDKIFVIGGAEIYTQVLSEWRHCVDKVYLTTVDTVFDCDTFFPVDLLADFEEKKFQTVIDTSHVEKKRSSVAQTFYKYTRYTDERQYLKLVKEVLEYGERRANRTGVDTLSIFGAKLEFDISCSIPFMTTRKLAWRTMLRELLFFISGKTDNKILQDQGVHIWDGNSSREFLDNVGLQHFKEGDLGAVYPFQWRHSGATYVDCDTDYTDQGIDQLAEVVTLLKTFPESRRILLSSWNPKDLESAVLPPCFTKNALVLTSTGYVSIKDIKPGDIVLTHVGNWRGVAQQFITEYTGDLYHIHVQCHPHTIEATPNHPFFCNRGPDTIPTWIKASALTTDHFVGFPVNCNAVIPIIASITLDNPKHWFLLGYFLVKGWIGSDNGDIFFLINDAQIVYFLSQCEGVFQMPTKITEGSDSIYKTTCYEWWEIFSTFQRHGEKKVPEWIHNAPVSSLTAFISGYKASECSQFVDVGIVLSLQRITAKIGYISCIEQTHSHFMGVQGAYAHPYHIEATGNTKVYIKDRYIWYPVALITKKEYTGKVYNLDVDEDHTYTVDNLAVHNCHVLSQWYVRERQYLDCQMYQRSADLGLGVPFNIASYATLTYMLAHLCGYTPGKFIHVIGDAHVYVTHVDQLKEQLRRQPFDPPTLRFAREITDIDDFKEEDFIIEGYNFHPHIKMNMVA